METTAYQIAERFIGIQEVPGKGDNPAILAMLKLDDEWPTGDEVPWCSAFCNYVAWLLRLPRSKSLAARSWLRVGVPIPVSEARPGFDVVILKRGGGSQPGPDVIQAPGHVGFYAGSDGASLHLLGGNQGNSVSVAPFGKSRLLGVRRLHRSGETEERVARAVVEALHVERPTLRVGSRGPHVERLQEALHRTGLSVGFVDGIFGSRTEAAVREFQAGNRLEVDGIAGPSTWDALLA